jgi:GAF domain-containing protein
MSPEAGVVQLARLLFAEESLSSILGHVAASADKTVPAALMAGAALLRVDRVAMRAATDDIAAHLDGVQFRSGNGPGPLAMQTGHTQLVHDVATDGRFPELSNALAATSIRTCMSLPLAVRHRLVGGLTLYGERVGSFGLADQMQAEQFAAEAAVVLANADTHDRCARLVVQLEDALTSRGSIEQAKGILMARRGCSADEAFDQLRETSQRTNCKLREVAAGIVEGAAK